MEINIGDILTMKKKHPCGGFEFEVTRTGADLKLRCRVCGRELFGPRQQFEKSIKAINGERLR